MMILGTSFALLAFLSASPSYAASPGFQGLPWHATRQQIEKKFIGQTKLHDCVGDWKEITASMGNECSSPYIDFYPIAGIPFKLNFTMSAQSHSLVSVDLNYDEYVTEEQLPTLKAKASDLLQALELKYGRPSHHYHSSPELADASEVMWLTKDSEIKLNLFYRANTIHGDVSTSVTVVYRPRPTDAASKL